MTNLNKLYTLYDVHSKKEQDALKDLLINHLPKEYTAKVILKLSTNNINVDSQTVRNTKNGFSKNILVFNAIIEIAKDYKDISNRLRENLQKTS
ncbi:hypothetical protein [Jejuia spongiicola]|uniref:Uncharacterized protein n=1 Tax=Jejuia spongiicola TaxID=2942207 RepID=A0ABT0QAS4_9FLAO|nr:MULTISPECIES: hypothetical protein [Flavobacteriaceae]MCL6294082.1 hypothetical protein [Jejuia spongiicola]PIA78397.1 hypothetical protein BFR04_02340 [Gaetbulibacter sp. 4G1]